MYPLVSIIIPFYNHKKYIQQTLSSIIEDTYPNKEIIIINDGSSDPDDSDIVQWIKEHPNVKIKYKKRENNGLTRTLNELVNLSDGKYIVICASDDYLINNTLTIRINILENSPNKMLLISDNIVVDDDDQLISNSNLFEMRKQKINSYNNDFGVKKMIVKRWSLAGPSWIAKKELFAIIGKFDENLIVEDWDFMLKVVSKNLAQFYPDLKVSAYRLHPKNTISNPDKQIRMWEDLYYTAKKHIKSFKNPYFKYLMWKNSRKNLKKLNKLKKAQAGHTSA